MFLDDTACNLASVNLAWFYGFSLKRNKHRFAVEDFEHACRLWTIALEISVAMAQFPSRKIAELSYRYRTLGLGFANIGGLLMSMGIAYNSDEGRSISGLIASLMTGVAYRTSAEMAEQMGPFPGYGLNKDDMLRVISNHYSMAVNSNPLKGVSIEPPRLDHVRLADGPRTAALYRAAAGAWGGAYGLGLTHGYRNAQVSVIAPTGTIGLVMDCDTTGIEPDFSIVKHKKLAGGGYLRVIQFTA